MVRLGKVMMAILVGGIVLAAPLAMGIHAGEKKEGGPVEEASPKKAQGEEGEQISEALTKMGQEPAPETPAQRVERLNKRIQVLLATAKVAETEEMAGVAEALRQRAEVLARDLREAAVGQMAKRHTQKGEYRARAAELRQKAEELQREGEEQEARKLRAQAAVLEAQALEIGGLVEIAATLRRLQETQEELRSQVAGLQEQVAALREELSVLRVRVGAR